MNNDLITVAVYLAVIITIGIVYFIYSSLNAKLRARFEKEKTEAVNKAVEDTSKQYERRMFLAELKAERQMKDAVDKAIKETTALYDEAFKEVKGIKVKVL